jgi:hypothetical protein
MVYYFTTLAIIGFRTPCPLTERNSVSFLQLVGLTPVPVEGREKSPTVKSDRTASSKTSEYGDEAETSTSSAKTRAGSRAESLNQSAWEQLHPTAEGNEVSLTGGSLCNLLLPFSINSVLQDHSMGRNPNTSVHILGALHPRSGVPIRHVLRKLQSSPDFKSQGARIGI